MAQKKIGGDQIDQSTLTDLAPITHATQHYPAGADPVNAQPWHGVVSRTTVLPLPSNLTTTTFTLATAATPMTYYNNGVKRIVNTNRTCTMAGTGLNFIYFNTSDVLTCSQTFPGLTPDSGNVIIAMVFWNGSNYGIVYDERHGYTRDSAWHIWAHFTIGARYGAGLTFSFAGTTNANTTFALSSGNIYDEDINYTITSPTTCNIFRQTAATTFVIAQTASTLPYLYSAGTQAVRSDTFALVTITAANSYFNVWVYGTTAVGTPVAVIAETVAPGDVNGYVGVNNARAINPPNLQSPSGLSPEFKLLYRLVVNGQGLIATPVAADDYRLTQPLPSGGVASSTASSVTYTPTAPDGSLNVQTALDARYVVTPGTSGNLLTSDGTLWTSAAPATIPLSTVTTAGDLIVGTGNAAVTRLAIGTNTQVLTSNGTTATWAAAGGGSGATFPIGAIVSTPSTPTGNGTWLACDGSWVSQSTYSSLYSVVGKKYTNFTTTFGTNITGTQIIWAGTRWLSVAATATTACQTSTDGINWSAGGSFTSTTAGNMFYGNGVTLLTSGARRSTNAGATWATVSSPGANQSLATDNLGNWIAVGGDRTVWFSSNNASSWTQTSNALPSQPANTNSLFAVNWTGTGWFVSTPPGASQVVRNLFTTDITGATGWGEISNAGLAHNNFTSFGSTIVGMGNNIVSTSTNNGTTFNSQQSSMLQTDIIPHTFGGGVMLISTATVGSISISTDGKEFIQSNVGNSPIGGLITQSISSNRLFASPIDPATLRFPVRLSNQLPMVYSPVGNIATDFALPTTPGSWIRAL